MIPLETQEQFEQLWTGKGGDGIILVHFTAPWCGPCQRLDKAAIEAVAKDLGVPYYVCDLTVNEYTAGYCGVRSIPTFMLQRPSEVLGKFTNAKTDAVCEWITETVKKGRM